MGRRRWPPGGSAGWYSDPERPDRLRYWDGRHWTTGHRPLPAWTVPGRSASIEHLGPVGPTPTSGPIAAIELPAPAAGVSSRQGPAGPLPGEGIPPMSSPPGTRMPIHRPADDGPPPPERPGGPNGGGEGGGGDERRPGRRRKWIVIGAFTAMFALVLGLSAEALRPRSTGPRVLTDTHFVSQANTLCNATLASLRPAGTTDPFGASITPEQAAAGADKAAAGLDALATKLDALPAAPADEAHIGGWLDGWHRYAALGHQWATFLREHGTAKPPSQLVRSFTEEATSADDFALANRLKACTFSYAAQVDPSSGF